jgi:two-component system NtrC family sensor kinase
VSHGPDMQRNRPTATDASTAAVAYAAALPGDVETRAIERQLHQSEKLAALRAIAAGLANEVGNPLAGVLGLLQLAERRTAEPQTRERLCRARDEIIRVGRLIRELGDFTRADDRLATIDINEVLRAALTLAKYGHEAAPVTVHLDTDPTLTAIVGSRQQLLQACLHLVMNAYDAVPAGGGELGVGSRRTADGVLLWFEDNGRGVDAATRPHIFEPFFTTKPAGAGTGLGLYVTRRIVADEFGGAIELTRAAPEGARFEVRIPMRARGHAAVGACTRPAR